MQTLTDIRALLAERGLAPNKRLGQNFLVDQNLLVRLVEESGVGAGDRVLEVGPGTGTLTEELLSRGCTVLAVELDRGLASLLADRLAPAGNRFTLLHADCMHGKRALYEPLAAELGDRPFTLVANLPYSIATPLLVTLLLHYSTCQRMCVTIQQEVADRLVARPGTDAYGEVSVLARALAEVQILARLAPECFWPRPQVHSAMVRMDRLATPLTDDPAALESICRTLFGRRRKQIGSVLGRSRAFPAGIDPGARAEALDVDQIIALATWREASPN